MKTISKILFVFFTMFFVGCTTDADDDFDASKVCPVEGVNAYGLPNRGTFVDERDGRTYKYTTIDKRMWMAENLKKLDGSNSEYHSMYGYESVCPSGWRIPSEKEWMQLIKNVGGEDVAGFRLKSTQGWVSLNRGDEPNGTDDCGFSIYPRISEGEDFSGIIAEFWTSTGNGAGGYETVKFGYLNQILYLSDIPNYSKFVRCIKD